MPACVAVTCWGWGDVWAFEDPESARLHPLVDTCDVILSSADDIYPRNWNYLFLPRMVSEVLRDREAAARITEIIQTAPDDKTRDSRLQLACVQIWHRLGEIAKQPPDSPKKICELIVRDRQRTDEWHRREENRRRPIMTTETATKEKPAKAPKEQKAKLIAGFSPDAKITLLKDKDGKAYGADNCPKRANSEGAKAFAKYRNGMTVQQAVDAGVPTANLRWDKDHDFISIG